MLRDKNGNRMFMIKAKCNFCGEKKYNTGTRYGVEKHDMVICEHCYKKINKQKFEETGIENYIDWFDEEYKKQNLSNREQLQAWFKNKEGYYDSNGD